MRRDVQSRSLLSDYHPKVSNYGYTGQEHLDSLNLIHMNGRVYDPAIGRFLSADTYVQDPTNLQSLNRYSYVWNNPLNATDPSGFFSLSINGALNSIGRAMHGVAQGISNPAKTITSAGNHLSKWTKSPSNQRLVVSIAIAVAAAYTGGAAASAFEGWQGWAAGAAVSGAGGYASGYVASDGNQEYARKSALTGMAFFTVGQYIQASDSTMKVAKVAAHGVVGGVAARSSGGTFESGFLSAAVSEGLTQSGAYDSVADGIDVSRGNIVYGAVASSLVGGTTSELTGGSFENGAITAAFGRLFNEELHRGIEAVKKSYYMWMEGPSEINMIPYASTTKGNENIEPFAHMSLALYSEEMGIYRTYSFGAGAFGVQSDFPYISTGSVYEDTKLGGQIIPGTLKSLNVNEFHSVLSNMINSVGNRGLYFIGNTCREWTERQYGKYWDIGKPVSNQLDPRK